jgi:NADH dehydrogenase
MPVRALVRRTSNPALVKELARRGVELVLGDLKDRASLDAVCQGVTAVLTSATTTLHAQPGDTIASVDLNGYRNLIDAASQAGVRRFVYTSYSRNLNLPCPLTDAKRTIEALIMRSGFNYTILRPGYFMETWMGSGLGIDPIHHRARIYGTGNAKVSWIATGDVAKFGVAALYHPVGRNAILELGGPEALSTLEVIRLCEQLGGRPFTLDYVTEEELKAQLTTSSDPLQQSFAALKLGLVYGDEIDMRDTLRLFPIRLGSVRDYLGRLYGMHPTPEHVHPPT